MDLIKTETCKDLLSYAPEHKSMIENINNHLPEINRATSFFGKRQSQFMDNLLTVSHFTPIRNARQIMSEITKARQALQEAYYKQKKEIIEIKKLERDLKTENDGLERELIQVSIEEKRSQQESSKYYISGAIRKINGLLGQYNSILEKHNCQNFNELDFEKQEEAYHIAKAFEQALTAARSRNGLIDEGNHIYLYQIGINGAAAQTDISTYLNIENDVLKKNRLPNFEMLRLFISNMIKKYQGCSKKVLEAKGMKENLETTVLLIGDK